MERQALDAQLMHDRQVVDWEAVRAHAAARGVGGWRWEAAWMAARPGQPAGTAAFRQALARGADPLSGAALAGMVAAEHARAALSDDQFRVLVGPVVVADAIRKGPETVR